MSWPLWCRYPPAGPRNKFQKGVEAQPAIGMAGRDAKGALGTEAKERGPSGLTSPERGPMGLTNSLTLAL